MGSATNLLGGIGKLLILFLVFYSIFRGLEILFGMIRGKPAAIESRRDLTRLNKGDGDSHSGPYGDWRDNYRF